MFSIVRLSAYAVMTALLAACSGGGSAVAPVNAPTAPIAPTTSSELTSLSAFTAQDNETGTILRVHPTRDVIESIGLREALRVGTANPNLLYHGGPIQDAPRLYVVFWGPSWQSPAGDPQGVADRLLSFYRAIGGGAWLNSVTQYTASDGTATGNAGSIFAGSYIDTASTPPARPSQSQLAAAAARAARHYGDFSASASYIVALPHGIRPSGFGTQYCAWHSVANTSGGPVAFTNLPYMPDAGYSCGANSVASILDGVTIVGGHEQAETESDPQLNAWYDGAGNENGDKCAWQDLRVNPAAGGFPTQPLWSNASSNCVQSY